MKILTKLQSIDKRILYVLVAVVVAVPLIMRPSQHPAPTPETLEAYNTINNASKDKLVIVAIDWGAGTQSENIPQTQALVRHLFQKNLKIAVIAWDLSGNDMAYQIIDKIAKEMGKKYGVDWVDMGFRIPDLSVIPTTLRGMAIDFPGTLVYDYKKTPVSKIPMLRNVRTAKDVSLVVDISSTSSMELWIPYYTGPNKIPLILAPTAVMSAEAYPYLNSGQISGMLNGVMGAAQYEGLIGMEHKQTDAARYVWALSAANVLIILFIILGNLEYFMTKRNGRRNRGGGANA